MQIHNQLLFFSSLSVSGCWKKDMRDEYFCLVCLTFRLPGAVAGVHTPWCGVSRPESRDALRPDNWRNSRPLLPFQSVGLWTVNNLTFSSGGRCEVAPSQQHHLHPALPAFIITSGSVTRNPIVYKKNSPDLVIQLDWKDYVYRNIGQILHTTLTLNIFAKYLPA